MTLFALPIIEHPTVPVMIDVPQVFLWIFGCAVTVVGYFVVRTLKQIDRNQQEMFTKLSSLRSEFDTLKGQHELLACRPLGTLHPSWKED